ncbi:MAG: hypothetical protein PHH83_02380 [Patescibacteria group bacterium]|nr:hypothetical protein [Patescibacteria group bacterium]
MKKALYLFMIALFCFTITGCTKQNKLQEQQDLIQQNQNMGFPESEDRSTDENNEIGQQLNQTEDTEDMDIIDQLLSDIDSIDNEIDSDEDIKEIDSIEE